MRKWEKSAMTDWPISFWIILHTEDTDLFLCNVTMKIENSACREMSSLLLSLNKKFEDAKI